MQWIRRPRTGVTEGLFVRPTAIYALIAGIVGIGASWIMIRVPLIQHLHENVIFSLDPSPERAYAYGRKHFDEADASSYDLDRAGRFFSLAAQKDPSLPYVYHELARLAFLRGDFNQALALIDIQIVNQGDTTPNSYYVRGLIEGYMGRYDDSINDYKHFLRFDPNDWAGINDCAWVLLKANRYQEAADMTTKALQLFPNNPWLLSTNATARYRLGDVVGAKDSIAKASIAAADLTSGQWSHAYPGNDPAIASDGVAALRSAIAANLALIEASSTSR